MAETVDTGNGDHLDAELPKRRMFWMAPKSLSKKIRDDMNKFSDEYGSWSIDDSSDKVKVSFNGRLSWDPHEGATLKTDLLDAETLRALLQLNDCASPIWMQIAGHLNSGPVIELTGAHITACRSFLGKGGHATLKAFQMTKSPPGIKEPSRATLDRISFNLDGLNDWIGIKQPKISFEEDGVHAKSSPDRTLQIAKVDGFTISIHTQSLYSANMEEGVGIKTSCSVRIESDQPFQFLKAQHALHSVAGFIRMALDKPLSTQSIQGLIHAGHPHPATIDFFQAANYVKYTTRTQQWEILIPFTATNTTDAIAKYCDLSKENPTVVSYYFSFIAAPDSLLSQIFLDTVHGIEGLSRHMGGSQFIERKSFEKNILPKLKETINSLPKIASEELKKSLYTRVRNGYEFSLGERLKLIAEKHSSYTSKLIGDASAFSEEVVKCRNNLAHGGLLKERSDLGGGYFILFQKIRLLFQLEMLDYLGYDEAFRREAADRSNATKCIRLNP